MTTEPQTIQEPKILSHEVFLLGEESVAKNATTESLIATIREAEKKYDGIKLFLITRSETAISRLPAEEVENFANSQTDWHLRNAILANKSAENKVSNITLEKAARDTEWIVATTVAENPVFVSRLNPPTLLILRYHPDSHVSEALLDNKTARGIIRKNFKDEPLPRMKVRH